MVMSKLSKLRHWLATLGQRLYDNSPISEERKSRIRDLAFIYAGFFFTGIDPYEQWLHREGSFLLRNRLKGRKIILVIDDKIPEYNKHAGGLATYQYVRLFGDMGLKVIFIPDNLYPSAPYIVAELQRLGVTVLHGRIDVEKWLGRYGKYVQYAWLTRPDVASKYFDIIRKSSSARVLYFTMDLHFLREMRRNELEPHEQLLIESQRLKEKEFDLFAKVDVILTPSTHEERIIKESFPKKTVFTIPLHFYEFPSEDPEDGVDFAEREGILFLGGFDHHPNADGVRWFVSEIFPQIKQRLPDVRFTVAGHNPPREILALENDGLRVMGYVPDLGPLFEKSRVFVAPLRYGAGVKGKIVTSMMHGVPVVTTSIGNEGLDLADGREASIADTPEAFAAQTVELYDNRALWERLAHGAQTYVRRHFEASKAQQLIQEALGVNHGQLPRGKISGNHE
jgi:glycosyltransferase involved in cell wall biosynthesis